MDYLEMLDEENVSRETLAIFQSLQRRYNELSKECEDQREAYRRDSLAHEILIASIDSGNRSFLTHPELFAKRVYKMTDAMIEIKEKENE